jgi:haloalkane dehalogenase
VVKEFVEHLDLQDAVVMGQDWGGPIGMDVASRMPDRIGGLVMGNTWFWPTESFTMKTFSLVLGWKHLILCDGSGR